MKETPQARTDQRQNRQALNANNGHASGNGAGYRDNRPEAVAQRELQEFAESSPRMVVQRKAVQSFNDSPAMTARREHLASLTGEQEGKGDRPSFRTAPLPAGLKSGVESLSGMAMDDVKVHYDSPLPAQLDALAYAQGAEIHLAPGQERHLPHEAWHIAQQKQGRVRETMQMKGGVTLNDDEGLEAEAEEMGAKALAQPEHSKPVEKKPGRFQIALGADRASAARTGEPQSRGFPPESAPTAALRISESVPAMAKEDSSQAPIQRQTANIAVPDAAKGKAATKITVIEATSELGSFDDPTVAANTVGIPNRAPTTPQGKPAYVANIVTTARNKDKTLTQVAAQYAAEAFDTAEDAAQRFALVLLANREEKPTLTAAAQTDDLKSVSTDQAAGIKAFPAAAGRSFWRRKWRAGPDSTNLTDKSVAEIRAILDGASKPEEAHKAAEDAARAEGLPPGVPNQARNKARAIPQTSAWINTFTSKGYAAFAHIGDADAVSLKATEDPGGTGAEKSLFSRYDPLITSKPNVEVLSGGYRFASRPSDPSKVPAHAAGAGGDGKALMAQTEQAVKVSELDMKVRLAMYGQDRGMPYFPEPNLLVRGDLYNQPGVSFGDSGPEWLKLKTSLMREGKSLRGQQRFTELQGVEVPLRKGSLCEFPADARDEMEALFGVDKVRNKKTWQFNKSKRKNEEVEDPDHISVFLSKAEVEHALGQDWADDRRFIFSRKAALVTDVGRFDQPYVDTSGVGANKSGTVYTKGQKDPLALFDPSRAHQSHAQWGAIKSAMEFTYNLSERHLEWLGNVMRSLLPQALFEELSETRDSRGTLQERTTAASSKLRAIKPQLKYFASFTKAVCAEIEDPKELNNKAIELKDRARDMTAKHKCDAVSARLTAHKVHADFIRHLDRTDLLNIWDAATSDTQPETYAEVTTALKAIGDAIANFLASY